MIATVDHMTDQEVVSWLKVDGLYYWRTFSEAVAYALVRSNRPITLEMVDAMSPEVRLKVVEAVCLRKAKEIK